MTALFPREVYKRFALAAVLRSNFSGQEPAVCLLAVCEALADMVEDDRLPDVETSVDIMKDMTGRIITERFQDRKHRAFLTRARAL